MPPPCLLYMYLQHVARRQLESSDSNTRCCRPRHISSLRRRGSGLDHLNTMDPAARMHQGNTFTLSHTPDRHFAMPASARAGRGGQHSTPIGPLRVFCAPRIGCTRTSALTRCVVKPRRGSWSPAHQRHLSSFEKNSGCGQWTRTPQ